MVEMWSGPYEEAQSNQRGIETVLRWLEQRQKWMLNRTSVGLKLKGVGPDAVADHRSIEPAWD